MSKTSPVPGTNGDENNETNRDFDKKSGFFGFLFICCLIVVGIGLIFKFDYDYDMAHPYIPFTFQVDFLEVNDKQFRLNITVNTKEARFFRTLQVTVEDDDQLVANTTIAPFHQDALSEKTIPVEMGMADTRLPDKVIDSNEGGLDFTVIVRGDNWKVAPRWGTGITCDMKMVCKGVRVALSSSNNTWSGSTKDGPFPCKYSTKDCHDD